MSADLLNIAIPRRFIPPLSRIVALIGVAIILVMPGLAKEGDIVGAANKLGGNAVTHWNTVATDAFTPSQGTNPMAQSRTLAILHAAMHDALNAIDRRFEAYTPGLADAPGASVDAAVAAAARDVLITLLPDQAALVEAAYRSALAAVSDGPAKTAGIATGHAAAAANITRRQGDGFEKATQPEYMPRQGPGEYQFTPPFNFAAQPGWGHVKPFIIELGEHAVEGPQRLSSIQYARDLAYVKGDRRHRQHDPDARAIRNRTVLVRGFTPRMEPDREHGHSTAKTGSLVSGSSVRAAQLRYGGWVHRGIRGQVSIPLLAT